MSFFIWNMEYFGEYAYYLIIFFKLLVKTFPNVPRKKKHLTPNFLLYNFSFHMIFNQISKNGSDTRTFLTKFEQFTINLQFSFRSLTIPIVNKSDPN